MELDLHLPPTSPEVKRYQRLKMFAALWSTFLGMGVLALFGFWWGPTLGAWLQETIGDNRWLRLLGVALTLGAALEVVGLPFDYYSGFVLEHRFELSNQTFRGWIGKRLKGYLLAGIFGGILLAGLYALLWWGGNLWWLWATVGWLGMTLVLGRILPVLILPLFYKVTPLDDPELRGRLEHLAAGTGLTLEGVYRLHLSEETKKANAALAGLGKSRRVLLGDTLLEQFSPAEIEVVFAHEVGHHVHHHLIQGIFISTVLALAGFWLVDVTLTFATGSLGYQGLTDPAALPLILLVLALFGFILSPAQNALSRFYEHQCDAYALLKTGDRDAYRSAFIKLAKINKADPDPHPAIAWFFYDHPPIRHRLLRAGSASDG